MKRASRISPQIEKCCLLLIGNESFVNAQRTCPHIRDLEILTGITVPHSTQHRLVNSYQLPIPKVVKRAKSLSVDGGTVRLRTPLGKQSEWKNYKAVKVHGRTGMAFFQNNESLINWVNQQSLTSIVSCLGDGHDGVWNILEKIGSRHQRREILDWYHLMENLHKVGGSNQRLRQAKSFLWHGLIDEAIALFDELKKKRCDPAGVSPAWERAPRQQARNFQNYLRKHRFRIPDYQLYQELGICIGEGSSGDVSSPACEPRSGSVESWIKQIGSRVKIVGAQWNPKNVP